MVAELPCVVVLVFLRCGIEGHVGSRLYLSSGF